MTAFTAEQGAAGRVTVLARLKDPVLALLQASMAGQASTRLEAGSVDDAVALGGTGRLTCHREPKCGQPICVFMHPSERAGPPIAYVPGSFQCIGEHK